MSEYSFPVLVVEDSDKKYDAVRSCLIEANPEVSITRAATMTDAERLILEGVWSLVVLDVSMDIAPSRQGPKGRGQANVGGLDIAQKMFLLDREAPTIIVTAFDSFSTSGNSQVANEILGFEDIARKARQYLPTALLGCLQYNSSNWRQDMIDMVRKVAQQ